MRIVAETGWVVPPRNPQAVAHVIDEALAERYGNADVFEARKSATRDRIQEISALETMVAKYVFV